MHTHLDTLYRIRTLFCRSNDLYSFEFWEKVREIMEPFTAQSKYSGSVIPLIYDKQRQDWIVSEGIRWIKSDLSNWTLKEGHTDGNLQLDGVEIFFPSMQQCNAEKITPDIIIKASVKATQDEMRYESLFSLFIKEEFFFKISQAQVQIVLNNLEDYLKPVFIAGVTRPWAIKKNELQYGESLHYFFPSVVLAEGDKFIFRKTYESWKAFDSLQEG